MEKSFPNQTEVIAHKANTHSNRRGHITTNSSLKKRKTGKYKVDHKPRRRKNKYEKKNNSFYGNNNNTINYTQKLISKDEYLKKQKDTQDTEAHFDETSKRTSAGIDYRLVWIMAVACALSVANFIYAQPLLAEMGRSFRVSANYIALTTTSGLLGYALGLIFIVPLGEKYNQRRLIVILLSAVTIALVEMAVAPMPILLIVGSGLVGLASVTAELLVPFAASLTPAKERGRVVGILVCGIFISTPLAVVLSGFVGQYLGWRAMYWIAAGITIALAIVLHFALPNSHTTKEKVKYLQLIGSLWKLLRSEPVLQEISILGVLVYGAFNVFWVTLSFVLSKAPYHYGSEVVGLLGLIGIAGALSALFVGKFADRRNVRYAIGATLVLTLLAFVVMWLVGQWLIGLIIGAILLDLGAQSHEAANETRIYDLESTVWNRSNTIFIFFSCFGGSLGSALGTLGWRIAKQNGVYATACLMLLIALGFYALHGKRIQQWRKHVDQQIGNCV